MHDDEFRRPLGRPVCPAPLPSVPADYDARLKRLRSQVVDPVWCRNSAVGYYREWPASSHLTLAEGSPEFVVVHGVPPPKRRW